MEARPNVHFPGIGSIRMVDRIAYMLKRINLLPDGAEFSGEWDGGVRGGEVGEIVLDASDRKLAYFEGYGSTYFIAFWAVGGQRTVKTFEEAARLSMEGAAAIYEKHKKAVAEYEGIAT